MTIRELYEESIKYEHVSLAHLIYYSLREGLVKPDDDESKLFQTEIDEKQLGNLIERNHLGLGITKIYSLKIGDGKFAFVFAGNSQEAIEFVGKELKTKPVNCHEYSMDEQMSRGNQFLSFRDMKKEFTSFPALAGYFERDINYL